MAKDLFSRHGISGRLSFGEGEGGLRRAVLKTAGSEAHVYLHGAHVTHFEKAGEPPLLFLSEESLFQADKPIRGGVPVVFPWFGPRQSDPAGNSPMHGFARLSEWEVLWSRASDEQTTLMLHLHVHLEKFPAWRHEAMLTYKVTLRDASLELALGVHNVGDEAFTFEEALHTYFAVSDVRKVAIDGLVGTTYIDKTENFARKVQETAPLKITAETDRIYLATQSTCTIEDPGHHRRIIVAKRGSDATVVWNPWIAKAKAMADFGDGEWPQMLCIETCNVNAHAVTLAPDSSHWMKAIIRSEPA